MQIVMRTAIWLLITSASFTAVPSSQPADVSAGLCAGDQAFQELLDQVLSLRLAGGRCVSELLAMVPDAERQFRQSMLEHVQRSAPRRRVDGTVEVDVWLPTPRVTQIVQEITARYLPEADLSLLAVGAVSYTHLTLPTN